MRIILCVILSCVFLSSALPRKLVKEKLKQQAKIYREEGYRLQSMGDPRGAIAYYQKAIELLPDYAEAYNDLGVAYESLGNVDMALDMYKKTVEIDPGYLPAYTNLALLYEAKGDIEKATVYWQKRYRSGKRGEYWHQRAKERLLKLGTYPQVRRQVLEDEAAVLSKVLAYKKEQRKLEETKEARMHFEIGRGLFNKSDFSGALDELYTALSLDPQDEELKIKITDLYIKAKRAHAKQQLKDYMEEAMNRIDEDDYFSAGKKIEEALSAFSSFSGNSNQP